MKCGKARLDTARLATVEGMNVGSERGRVSRVAGDVSTEAERITRDVLARYRTAEGGEVVGARGAEDWPAPEVPCRVAGVAEMGRGALGVQRAAEGAGWGVVATYARGTLAAGRPGARVAGGVVDSIAVRCTHRDHEGRVTRAVGVWIEGRFSGGVLFGHSMGVVNLTELKRVILSNTDGAPWKGTRGSETEEGNVAEVVEAFPTGPKTGPLVQHIRFDWAPLADGKIHRVQRGADFDVTLAAQRKKAEAWAAKNGRELQYEIERTVGKLNKDGVEIDVVNEYLYVRFVPAPAA